MKSECVLVVDFDGCYVRNDFFAEQFVRRLIENPFHILAHFVFRRRGLLALKKELLAEVSINYPIEQMINNSVQNFIDENKNRYARVVLVSASPQEFIDRALEGTKVFDEIHGSTNINLKSSAKLAYIKTKFGSNFHYIGNSKEDVVILRAALKGFMIRNQALHEFA